MGKLAYIYHPVFDKHDPGRFHPESANRLRALQDYLNNKGFFNRVKLVEPQQAPPEAVELVHTPDYVRYIQSLDGVQHQVIDIGDTVLSEHSTVAAFTAAGSALEAVELIYRDGFDKVFMAVRPPGHHAERAQGRGFCIFNNIAIGARYAQQKGYAKNVLIVDWDLHHGNGTQQAFYEDNSVFYFSIHQYPFFPGSGSVNERGEGAGEGFTINVPLTSGHGDDDYIAILEKSLAEIEQRFNPDLLMISAGFDAHRLDPIGGMLVTEAGFYKMTEMAARFAQRHCNGRIISCFEGGYSVEGMAASVYKHLMCLLKH